MKTWVALLRAVNVGEFTLEMAAVRAACEAAGLLDVRTYIASGNVVLRKAGDEKKVKREVEAALTKLAASVDERLATSDPSPPERPSPSQRERKEDVCGNDDDEGAGSIQRAPVAPSSQIVARR